MSPAPANPARRRTQTYRAGRLRPRHALYVRAAELGVPTDAAPDPDRNRRAALGCLILAAATGAALMCGGVMFIATLLWLSS